METSEGVLLPSPQASSRLTVLPQANSVGTKGKSHLFRVHGKTQACEMVSLRIQGDRCSPLSNNCIEEILSSTRCCLIWEMTSLE